MNHFNEWKENWQKDSPPNNMALLDEASLTSLVKGRTKIQKNKYMQYFWASFIYQIIMYGVFTHIAISYWNDGRLLAVSVLGVLLFIPFTIILMKKFKRLAVLGAGEKDRSEKNLKDFVIEHHRLMKSFFTFKWYYELFLIPLTAAILVWMFFRIYISGGAGAHPAASVVLFLLILGGCAAAITAENNRNFRVPLRNLEAILTDLETEK